MKFVHRALVASFFVGIAACGNHNNAPVVYGADASRQARIYNSPDDIYRKQQLERARQAQARAQIRAQAPTPQYAVARDIEPVQLTPVSEIYLDKPDPQRAAPPPARMQKAKGYIEVQRGDTVYAVARRFNVSPQSIIEANNLYAPYDLSVGQALKLPKGAAVVTTADATTRRVVARDTLYNVRHGDTLYSISRASRVPVETIAKANRLRTPYTLAIGQQIVVPQTPVGEVRTATAVRTETQTQPQQTRPPRDVGELTRNVAYTKPAPVSPKSLFAWPVRGAVIAGYGPGELGRRNEGVNIAAPSGTAVRAAAGGEVVYRGAELEGYGNLLLVRHQDGFVTAYAHNDTMLVRKGQKVRQGQIIAKVGSTGAVKTPQLHFEIRRDRKSVDPLALLGSQ